MAEEQSKGIQQIEGCEVIYDMGSGLVIAKVPLDKVKEQDINARIMKNEMQDQLTANIKKRGQLESLPLFVLVDGKLEIISGHHRVKSARAAEMKEIIAIVDVSGLSRSKIAAKQLAHNAISGFDDDSTLREIVKMMDDVDDMIESYSSLRRYAVGHRLKENGKRHQVDENLRRKQGYDRVHSKETRKEQFGSRPLDMAGRSPDNPGIGGTL